MKDEFFTREECKKELVEFVLSHAEDYAKLEDVSLSILEIKELRNGKLQVVSTVILSRFQWSPDSKETAIKITEALYKAFESKTNLHIWHEGKECQIFGQKCNKCGLELDYFLQYRCPICPETYFCKTCKRKHWKSKGKFDRVHQHDLDLINGFSKMYLFVKKGSSYRAKEKIHNARDHRCNRCKYYTFPPNGCPWKCLSCCYFDIYDSDCEINSAPYKSHFKEIISKNPHHSINSDLVLRWENKYKFWMDYILKAIPKITELASTYHISNINLEIRSEYLWKKSMWKEEHFYVTLGGTYDLAKIVEHEEFKKKARVLFDKKLCYLDINTEQNSIGTPFPKIEGLIPLMNPAATPLDVICKNGEVTLFDFWATSCESCQKPMAHNQEMLEKHPEWAGKVRIIGISLDADVEAPRAMVSNKKWNKIEHYFDEDGRDSTRIALWKSDLFNLQSNKTNEELSHLCAKTCKYFSIHGIPFCVLVDKDGVIKFTGRT